MSLGLSAFSSALKFHNELHDFEVHMGNSTVNYGNNHPILVASTAFLRSTILLEWYKKCRSAEKFTETLLGF